METLGLFLVVAVLAVGLGLRGRVRGGAVWTAFQNRTKPRAVLAESPVLASAGSPSNAADDDVLVPAEAPTPATVSLLTAVSPPAPAAPIAPVAAPAPLVSPVVAPPAPLVAPAAAAALATPVVAPSTPSTPATAVKAVAPATKPKTVAAKATAPKAVAATTAAPAGKTATKAAPATKTTARQAAATTTRPAAKTTTARPKTTTAPPKAAAARPRKTATKSAPVPSCTALVDNPAPVSGDTVVVTVASNVPTTPFTVTAHYRSKKTVLSGVTDGAGTGSVTFDIGAATKGYKVKVDVNVSGKATCGTEFTPR